MESADDYPGVVAEFGKWRVIECRDGEQWILQRKSGTWEARSYCRTSEALRRVVREHVGAVELPDLPKWLAEPVRFKSGVRVDSGAAEAHSPTRTMKSRPTALSDSPSGRLSACGGWRLWGPEFSKRSLRLATLNWNEAIRRGTTDFAMPEPKPAPPIAAPELPVTPSVPLVPDDADPLEIPEAIAERKAARAWLRSVRSIVR
jgi:hypothetical protein